MHNETQKDARKRPIAAQFGKGAKAIVAQAEGGVQA
jgi:hypothetical protein